LRFGSRSAHRGERDRRVLVDRLQAVENPAERRGRRETTADAVEQRRHQATLQRRQPARGRRLIDAERARRPAQGFRARDPLDEFEIGPASLCVHAGSPPHFSD